jgi:hypothetical protein
MMNMKFKWNGNPVDFNQISRLSFSAQLMNMVNFMYEDDIIVSMNTVFGLIEKVSE